MSELRQVSPADLLVDTNNPRLHTPNNKQRDAMRELVKHQDRKLLALAKDIVENGLNPSEFMICMPLRDDPNRYIVLEGNRRLVAIKALENPGTFDGACSKSTLEELTRLSLQYRKDAIETVDCVVVPDRETATHWIVLRHGGSNDGAGIVKWGQDEQLRFRNRGSTMPLHIQVLDFLVQNGDISIEQRSKVPADSLRRLLTSRSVREKLGIDSVEKVLRINAKEDEVRKALKWVVTGLIGGRIATKDIYSKEDRTAFATKIPANMIPTKASDHGESVPVTPRGGEPAPAKKSAAKRATKARDSLIPRDCVMQIAHERIGAISRELRKLSLESYPNAIAVLFRVFVELSVDEYSTKYGIKHSSEGGGKPATLGRKVQNVVEHLRNREKLTDQQARGVKRFTDGNSPLGPGLVYVHQYVHNQWVYPAGADLRTFWDNLQPFCSAMWSD